MPVDMIVTTFLHADQNSNLLAAVSSSKSARCRPAGRGLFGSWKPSESPPMIWRPSAKASASIIMVVTLFCENASKSCQSLSAEIVKPRDAKA